MKENQLKLNIFNKKIKNLFITTNSNRIFNFGLVTQIISLILYDIYKAVFNFTIVCFIFLIAVMLYKKFNHFFKSVKLIYSINAVLLILCFSILIGMILLRPNFTPGQAQKIVVDDFKTKIKEEIKSKDFAKTKKLEDATYFIGYDYMIDLGTEDKNYVYTFDPITGRFSVEIYSKDNNSTIQRLN